MYLPKITDIGLKGSWTKILPITLFMPTFAFSLFWPLKANTWKLKNISCNRNEPKKNINTWQITRVPNSTKRHADNSGNHADLWSVKVLPWHGLTAQLYLKILRITQHEAGALQKHESEATKKGWETEKSTANVQIPPGGTPYNGLYGEAPPERGAFFRVQAYKRVGKSVI